MRNLPILFCALISSFLFGTVFTYSQTSTIRVSISPNTTTSLQQNTDLIIDDGLSISNLSTGDVVCVQSTEGNDMLYDFTYSGRDFDKDGIKDQLKFRLRLKAYKNSTFTYSAVGASSAVALGTTATVENSFSFWGVNGTNETTYNDIDPGETLSFQVENSVLTHSGTGNYSSQIEFTSVYVNETNAGNSHLIIDGIGSNLNSYSINLDATISYNSKPTTIYLTGAGSNATNREWGVQAVSFIITYKNNDNPNYWDLEDYSSYSTGSSHTGINYPANWMSEEKYPCFSWEVIPQHSTFKSGQTLPETTYEKTAEFSLIDVNGNDFGYATWDEGMWIANAKLKSYNPTAKTSFYMNSQIEFPWYLHSPEFLLHPEWMGSEDQDIRGYTTYNHDNADLRQFWVNNILQGLDDDNVDFAFIDKTASLPSPFYNASGIPDSTHAQSIDLLYKSLPATKFLIGNTLRNESAGGNRSAMQVYDGSYLERWTVANKSYTQTESEAFAVSIQLMREALKKGKIIMLRNTDDVYNTTGVLTNEHFYAPLAGFLMAVEKNGFISYHGSNLAYSPNLWYTRDLEYLSNYLGAPLGDPIKDGLVYSRSFENLDVTLDLSAGDDLASAKTSFTWKGMKRPEPIYDYKTNTFKATLGLLTNFTLTENVINPLRDCACQSEFVGKLNKAENKASYIRFDIANTPITTLEQGVFKFKVYTSNNTVGNNIRMELKNLNEANPTTTKLSKSQTITSNQGWVEYTFDFRGLNLLSSQYNAIDIYITASNTASSQIANYYFESLRGPELSTSTLGINTNSIQSDIAVTPNPFTDFITIDLNEKPISKVEIFNTLGQMVAFKNGNNTTMKLDLNTLHSGFYIVRITSNNQVFFKKIVKK